MPGLRAGVLWLDQKRLKWFLGSRPINRRVFPGNLYSLQHHMRMQERFHEGFPSNRSVISSVPRESTSSGTSISPDMNPSFWVVEAKEARKKEVSIHAPAWGATATPAWAAQLPEFQSTPPRGGRPTMFSGTVSLICFNPRPRVGGDVGFMERLNTNNVSIHAPAWGATDNQGDVGVGLSVSIHAPAWGATFAPGHSL